MLDRLVELLYRAHHNASCVLYEGGSEEEILEEEARYLLKYGVILPPCKVGDTVYMISPGGKIHENLVIGISVRGGESPILGFLCSHALTFREDHIGKTVFRTREEAEQALKGDHQ